MNNPLARLVTRSALLLALAFVTTALQAQSYTFTTLAGTPGSPGAGDTTSQFSDPAGVAVDGAGNLYVADSGNHTIRKIASNGVVTTLAGLAGISGANDGTGSAARFALPTSVVVDNAGNIYTSELIGVIRRITSGGTVTSIAGTPGSALGFGMAVDSTGVIYVADLANHVIYKIASGFAVTILAGETGVSGSADGTGAAARFKAPFGLALDNAGNVYVADSGNHTIRRITSAGVVTTLAGLAGTQGNANGTGTAARFNVPYGVAVDSAGNVFVTDSFNHTIRKVTSGGVVTTLAGLPLGTGSTDGVGSAARFDLPLGIAVDSAGNLYVVDSHNQAIRKVTSAGTVTTLAGTPGIRGSTDRPTLVPAQFNVPFGVAVDNAGNTWVADTGNKALRMITSSGAVGTWTPAGGVPGVFLLPTGIALDSAGSAYIADSGRHVVFKITKAGLLTTLAGSVGNAGSANGTGTAARFNEPAGVAVDGAGNVYVTDNGNDTVRKITSDGVVTTLAGSPGTTGSANGTGNDARFDGPIGIAVDITGNVYVADTNNHTIRRITNGGVVTTLAGSAGNVGSVNGTGTAARFNDPTGLALDNAGNLYVTDNGSDTIRRVTSAGVVTTLAGVSGSSGSANGVGTAARFDGPTGIAVDSAGNLYVADGNNHTVRNGALGVAPAFTGPTTASATVGVGFSYTATFSGTPTGPLTASALPGGLSFTAATGVLSGTPTTAGTFPITFGATNGFGSGSGVLTLTIAAATGTAPTITTQPVAQTAAAGGSVTFSVVATGNPAPTYQWRKDGAAISGATASTLVLNGITSTSAGSYTVVVTNGAGAVTSAAASLTVTTGGTTTPVAITVQPQSQAVAPGANVTLSVTATGSPAPTYQWLKDGVAITGATASSLVLNNVSAGNAGSYSVMITNLAGAMRSNPANLAVVTPNDPATSYTFSTLAGLAGVNGLEDGVGSAARFSNPAGLAVDGAGNVYVANLHLSTIRKIDGTGLVTTVAGTVQARGSTDGVGSAARFRAPIDVAVDSAGNLYVAEYADHTIRKITSGGSVSTLAGTAGSEGSTDGAGSAARFKNPRGVTVDNAGTVYVADTGNHTIRRITSAGVVTTLAGSAGTQGSTNGTGAAARFFGPTGVAADAIGNVFVADSGNQLVRKVTSNGTVTTVAGSERVQGSSDGTGSSARFRLLSHLAVDGAGNLYVTDTWNHTIRKITNSGEVTTIGGVAGIPGSADGAGNTARFNVPDGIAVDRAGNLYVTDGFNHTIRKGVPPVGSAAPTSALANLSVRTTMASDQILTVGAVVSGGAKTLLIRAAGPALGVLGVTGVMVDPRLELYTGGPLPAAANNDWPASLMATFASVSAFPFGAGSRDAALAQSVNGAFTVQAQGTGPGTVIVEAYDVAGGTSPRLINLSARNRVGTGEDILIAGFFLAGTGTKQLLIRAIGPGLAAFGVAGTLLDPILQVFNGSGAVVASNDNWSATLAPTFEQVAAFALPPNSRDAAVLVTLPAGASYTVQVSGVNDGTGEALIEVYELP